MKLWLPAEGGGDESSEQDKRANGEIACHIICKCMCVHIVFLNPNVVFKMSFYRYLRELKGKHGSKYMYVYLMR